MKYKYYFILLFYLILGIVSCNIVNQQDKSGKKANVKVDIGPDRIAKVYENIHFEGTAYSEAGFINTYEWDFDGDGTIDKKTSNAVTCSHTYNTAGIYTAVLKATDEYGNSGEDSCTIKVGLPKPMGGDNIWGDKGEALNENFSIDYSPAVFYYNNKYYMIFFNDSGDKRFSVSNDGVKWQEINSDAFPISIPDEASDSTDIEIKYIDNQFILTFVDDGKVYIAKSTDGTNWSGDYLDTELISGYKSPTYVKTSTYEIVWAVKTSDNKIYYKVIGSGSDPIKLENIGTSDTIYRCRVMFDGKTYLLWYTKDNPPRKSISLVYSETMDFSQYTTCGNIISNFRDYYSDGAIGSSVIFNYSSYNYFLYIKGKSLSIYKIGVLSCNQFTSMPGYPSN